MNTAKTVICLHGMWMRRGVMLLVKRRLNNDHQYRAHLFGYPSMNNTLDQNAQSLASYIAEREFDRVHLVGHSLGGVVAMRALALHPDMPVQRVVCLGSPLCGSRPALRLKRMNWGKHLVGQTVMDGVVDAPAKRWAGEVCLSHEIGVIAGTISLGLGRLTGSFDEANDGTVAVSETQLPGLKDHLCMPVNHTGLAISKDVTDQIAAFFRRGEFHRDD